MAEVEIHENVVASVEIDRSGGVEVEATSVIVATVEIATGPPGPPGSAGGALSREVAFSTPTATWVLPLGGWGRRPHVTLYDTAGIEIEADVFATAELVSVTFPTPTAGSAVLT